MDTVLAGVRAAFADLLVADDEWVSTEFDSITAQLGPGTSAACGRPGRALPPLAADPAHLVAQAVPRPAPRRERSPPA